MIHPKYWPLVWKQAVRRPTRSLLTIAGVAVAMFLFVAIQAMQRGVAEATETSARDTNLVVYRRDRYCPMTSQLPERYGRLIERFDGVTEVLPMRVVPTNCRTSLDVITFRGVPAEQFARLRAARFELTDGSLADWTRRSDAVLLGEQLARRRGFRVGDRFDAAGITVYVAGIYRAEALQDQTAAYVHLPFLQQNTGLRKLGIVTQFNVRVSSPGRSETLAREIDEVFRADQEPTSTYPEKAFVLRAAYAAIEIISFTRWLGYACLAAVLALVGNAIVLSVQDRIRDHAIFQTLGYAGGLIGRLILTEGMLLGTLGGAVGSAGVWAVNSLAHLTLTTEGLSIPMSTNGLTILLGGVVSTVLGALAGLVPAWQASRREVAECFRTI